MTRLRPLSETLRKLLLLSGNRCAFTDCTAPLTHKGVLIGELAHITAAEPGGPRYDATRDDEFRRSFANLFYLCRHHHAIIDRHEFESEYTASILSLMKKNHEASNESNSIKIDDNILDQAIDQSAIHQGNVLYSGTQHNIQQNFFGNLGSSAEYIAKQVANVPTEEARPSKESGEEILNENDNGLLDKISDTELEMPKWTHTIESMSAEIRKIEPILISGTEQIDRSDSFNKGVSGRLAIIKDIAKTLNPVATSMESLGQEYSRHFELIEPGILAILDIVEANEDKLAEYSEFLESILGLTASSEQSFGPVSKMIDSLGPLSAMSKDLKKTLNKIESGLSRVLDSGPRMQAWSDRIQFLQKKNS